MQEGIEKEIQARRKYRKVRKEKNRKKKRLIKLLFVILMSITPLVLTIYLRIHITALLIIDIIWFAALLITYIWIFN